MQILQNPVKCMSETVQKTDNTSGTELCHTEKETLIRGNP